jgi:hypothetical protein
MNLQHTIKKILKEKSNKKDNFKNFIQKVVDNDYNGYIGASKILGMSITDIFKYTESPIDFEMASIVLYDNMSNGTLPSKYQEFNISTNKYDGVTRWVGTISDGFSPNTKEVLTVMATPFWDGDKITPVEIESFVLSKKGFPDFLIESEGNHEYYENIIRKSEFKNIDELFNWYNNVYLPEVYFLITKKLLPKVYEDTKITHPFLNK